ncbi:MAG: PEGA domain-containing protein [Polyangiales bacterium]
MTDWRWVALTAAAIGCAAGPSRPAVDPTLEALLAQGVRERTEGHDVAALATFRQAHRRSATPRVVAQLALAEQANSRWLDAASHLEFSLRAADDPWVSRHRAVLDGALEEIARHLGRLFVAANVDGAELRVDGRVAATLPMRAPTRVEAGDAVIEVRAEGYEPFSRRLEVRAGAVTRASVRLRPAASAR